MTPYSLTNCTPSNLSSPTYSFSGHHGTAPIWDYCFTVTPVPDKPAKQKKKKQTPLEKKLLRQKWDSAARRQKYF